MNLLEKRGLITRERHGDDERGVVARITPAGESLRSRIYPEHLQIARDNFFSKLTADELEAIRSGLTRVAHYLR